MQQGKLQWLLGVHAVSTSYRPLTPFFFLSAQFYYSLSLFLLLEVALAVCFFLTYYVEEVKNVMFPGDALNKAILHYRDDKDMRDLIDSLQSSVSKVFSHLEDMQDLIDSLKSSVSKV